MDGSPEWSANLRESVTVKLPWQISQIRPVPWVWFSAETGATAVCVKSAHPVRVRRYACPKVSVRQGEGGTGMRKCMDAGNLHRRLAKILGQVQAIDRMVDEDIPCEDILSQLNAAKSALNKVGQVVLEGHIRHCVLEGLQNGDVDETLSKFTKTIERFANMG